jgi:hypothetical protein
MGSRRGRARITDKQVSKAKEVGLHSDARGDGIEVLKAAKRTVT